MDAVREQVETVQEMDKHETIAEKEAEVAAEAAKETETLEVPTSGMTEVVEAPAGSGKIVININATAHWLKAHGLPIEADAQAHLGDPPGIEVYDNGGKTFDRYTVVVTNEPVIDVPSNGL